MRKINIHNDDVISILSVVLIKSPLCKDIDNIFKVNTLQDLNAGFIYDEPLRYIIDTVFGYHSGFNKHTLHLFYGSKNCWIIHNKLIELLQSSTEWWSNRGDFKMVVEFNKNGEYFDCYIFYDNENKNNKDALTTVRIDLLHKFIHKKMNDENYLMNVKSSLAIIDKLITFSNCTGFYKWKDLKLRLVEPLNFSDIENVINEARKEVKKQDLMYHETKKDFDKWQNSQNEALDLIFKTFNDLENNILNHIDNLNQEQQDELNKEEKTAVVDSGSSVNIDSKL